MTEQTTGQSNVLKFRMLIDSDPALQAEVSQHVGNGTWNAASIVDLAHTKGLDFSADDIVDVLDEDDELSDFELELVAAAGVSCNDDGA
ncbi:MAG: hypothetical protein JJ878_18535 [Alphaproteobacteria bacterium]|nr:hypothetical protein [Alphaproteobacteria bacterium]MBO6864639.1 hypothetical protein [Alphaproteobacteria bacterium]